MPKLISDRPDLSRQARAEPQVFRSEAAYEGWPPSRPAAPKDLVWRLRGSWAVEVGGIRVVRRGGPSCPCRCSTRSYRGGSCDWA